jgi:hypothetical protein
LIDRLFIPPAPTTDFSFLVWRCIMQNNFQVRLRFSSTTTVNLLKPCRSFS